jgi:hypothetical protein
VGLFFAGLFGFGRYAAVAFHDFKNKESWLFRSQFGKLTFVFGLFVCLAV